MRHKKRNLWWLILGLIFFVSLILMIFLVTPTKIVILAGFFCLLFLFSFFISFYLLQNPRRSFLISSFVVIWLMLRAFGLKEFFYPVLLAAVLTSLELMLNKR